MATPDFWMAAAALTVLWQKPETPLTIENRLSQSAGKSQRNFLMPAPLFNSLDLLNVWLEKGCQMRQHDAVRGHTEPIRDRLMRDLDTLMALLPTLCDASEKVSTRGTPISMVRYRNNDYSVPVAYAHHEVQVRGYVHGAVKHALGQRIIGYDAAKHLVLCRIERRPPRLDLDIYPSLPRHGSRPRARPAP